MGVVMKFISDKQLDQLISLGKTKGIELSDNVDLFHQFTKVGWINRQRPEYWSLICSKLTIEDHIALLKAITLAEKHLNWLGGYIASAIWIYRLLDERADCETSGKIARWVVDNTSNKYVPFRSEHMRAVFEDIPEEDYKLLTEGICKI